MNSNQNPDPSSSFGGDDIHASTSSSSTHVKRYRPYFSTAEIERLSAKQRGKLSVAREERGRQQACGFIDAVGLRCGFPRGTIATAQMLYIRFHLFFAYKDFNYMEVSLAALYVSSKLHDTLKKPRDIILASYPLRYPHLLGSRKGGAIDPGAVDQAALEAERGRVLGIERLVLESVCFRFTAGGGGLGWVVKLAKSLKLSKEASMSAWRTAIDCYRTPVSLSYAPHTIALGSIYACALLSLAVARPHDTEPAQSEGDEQSTQTWSHLAQLLGSGGAWEDEYHVSASEVDAIVQSTLDLHITILSTPPSDPQHALTPSPTSPRDTPTTDPSLAHPSTAAVRTSIANTAFRLPVFWTVQTLTDLKVYLRERQPQAHSSDMEMDTDGGGGLWDGAVSVADSNGEEEGSGMGQNEGTTRFVWDHGVAA